MNQSKSIYRGRHFPPAVIAHTVYLYHRFTLSLRDVEELLAARGISVSYETIRVWCAKYEPTFARRLRKHHGQSTRMNTRKSKNGRCVVLSRLFKRSDFSVFMVGFKIHSALAGIL